ncbi:sensor domain-containing diguanylate cyclase [Roseateles chitosanitabidus]|uniref:sensor domain-containing diguanylate cyclase n=1 Tax=Roseateles chitosanitabidus TaxID=65048 RepID=UPI00082F7310|nr:sensor domain-containing diguanylate cyclase [Roseateles chitosanitabidus]MBO9687186.1 sensor domain-containing diguanylate cyclase [Roseateles chitosanitabidus]
MDALLAQLSATVPAARNVEDLTRPLLEMLGTVTGLESTYFTTIDLTAGRQTVLLARNVGSMTIPEGLTVDWSDTLCKRALDEGRMATTDVGACWGDSDAARQLGIQTYVSAPVRGDDGELLGTLCAASGTTRPIAPETESLLRLFSSLIGQNLQRERLVADLRAANEQLTTYALTDALTGLPNRRALFDEVQRQLQRAARDGSCVLVGGIDLDGFKAINDELGHQRGDEFLRQIAQRLSLELRGSDMLGRIGGDEFVVVGPGLALGQWPATGLVIDQGEALIAARTLEQRATLATVGRFELDGRTLQYAGASVGVVAINPVGATAEDALHQADERMYEIKRARRRAAPAPSIAALQAAD